MAVALGWSLTITINMWKLRRGLLLALKAILKPFYKTLKEFQQEKWTIT